MDIVLSILTGVLYASGVYLLLRRSIVKLILGIIFLSNATNLLVFIAGGLLHEETVFLGKNKELSTYGDPLPQALVLTAIVIGFGIIALTLVLKYKYYQATGTDDLDNVKETDKS
jgi:multicomponent Na+:H+ antiporter subunit C